MVKNFWGYENQILFFLLNFYKQKSTYSCCILRVATELSKKYDIKFIDLSNKTNYYQLIDKFIQDNNLEVICLTATTPQISTIIPHHPCGIALFQKI